MKHNDSGFVPLNEVLGVWRDTLLTNGPLADSVPLLTGYSALDGMIGPLDQGDLLVLGSRQGPEKSSLALNICTNIAKSGWTCGIVSPIMSREQVAMRMMVAESGIDSHRLRLGLLSEQDQHDVADADVVLSELPIFIDDTPCESVDEMQSKVRRLQTERGLDFLLVDDLQSIRGAGATTTQRVGHVARMLKIIARESRLPVLACSQLSRAVASRVHLRPQLKDLRDSGEIEESADVAVLLHREDMAFSEEEWKHCTTGRPYPRNVVELIIAKNRQGTTGTSHLYFKENIMRFDELARYETSAA